MRDRAGEDEKRYSRSALALLLLSQLVLVLVLPIVSAADFVMNEGPGQKSKRFASIVMDGIQSFNLILAVPL